MKALVKLAALSAAAVVATVGAAAPAFAHGEKSQQAFLRMRTLNWYDVAWSKTSVAVNEEMVLSGKVHVFSAWPQAVANPRVSFLNAGEPGPVLVRTAQFIGEQFALPVAVESLRAFRSEPPTGQIITISAADPLNLVGIVVPGEKVPAISGRFVRFQDGVAIGDTNQPAYLEPVANAG